MREVERRGCGGGWGEGSGRLGVLVQTDFSLPAHRVPVQNKMKRRRVGNRVLSYKTNENVKHQIFFISNRVFVFDLV